jgi:hypothetical protein
MSLSGTYVPKLPIRVVAVEPHCYDFVDADGEGLCGYYLTDDAAPDIAEMQSAALHRAVDEINAGLASVNALFTRIDHFFNVIRKEQ